MQDYVSHDELSEIITDVDKKKIYTTTKDTGNKSTDFRDCIDIAAKIAYGLSSDEVFKLYKEGIDISDFSLPSLMIASESDEVPTAAAAAASAPASGDYCSITTAKEALSSPVVQAIQYKGKASTPTWFDKTEHPIRIRQSSTPEYSVAFR